MIFLYNKCNIMHQIACKFFNIFHLWCCDPESSPPPTKIVTVRQTEGRTVGRTDGRTCEQTNDVTDGRRTDGWPDG